MPNPSILTREDPGRSRLGSWIRGGGRRIVRKEASGGTGASVRPEGRTDSEARSVRPITRRASLRAWKAPPLLVPAKGSRRSGERGWRMVTPQGLSVRRRPGSSIRAWKVTGRELDRQIFPWIFRVLNIRPSTLGVKAFLRDLTPRGGRKFRLHEAQIVGVVAQGIQVRVGGHMLLVSIPQAEPATEL